MRCEMDARTSFESGLSLGNTNHWKSRDIMIADPCSVFLTDMNAN